MIGFKGQLSFPQYMPNKLQNWEMIAWALKKAITGVTLGTGNLMHFPISGASSAYIAGRTIGP